MTSDLTTNPTDEILRLHEEVSNALQTSLGKAIRIGELLTKQKAALKHGEFGPWAKTLPFSQSTVNRYMKVYAHQDDLKLVTVTNLVDAYKLGPKRERAKPEVIDTEGEEVEPAPIPSPQDALLKEEEAEPDPEASGDPLADIRNGLGVAPLNAPEEADPEPPPEEPSPEFDEYMATVVFDEPEPPVDPLRAERDALPAPWVEALREIQLVGAPEDKVGEALGKLLKWVRAKYPTC